MSCIQIGGWLVVSYRNDCPFLNEVLAPGKPSLLNTDSSSLRSRPLNWFCIPPHHETRYAWPSTKLATPAIRICLPWIQLSLLWEMLNRGSKGKEWDLPSYRAGLRLSLTLNVNKYLGVVRIFSKTRFHCSMPSGSTVVGKGTYRLPHLPHF